MKVHKSPEVQEKLKCDKQPSETHNLPQEFFKISLRDLTRGKADVLTDNSILSRKETS